MKNIEVVETCPFGSVCEEIKDNKLHRCKLYITVKGTHPQTGEDDDRQYCALAFTPIAVLENAKWTKGTKASVESGRNEFAKVNDNFETMIGVIASSSRQNNQLPEPEQSEVMLISEEKTE